MFTGIIEHVGRLAEIKPMAGGFRIGVATALASELKPGDSIAVNGVCLTTIVTENGQFYADIGPETARVTTLGGLARGQLLNLEQPVRVNAVLGGHLVQGHVDGVGSIQDVRADGESHWITVSYPSSLAPYFIRKGSVAVDGISLTIAGLGDKQFDLQIIPFTWEHTSFQAARPGDKVNLECDMIGKYVVRTLELAGEGMGRKGQ